MLMPASQDEVHVSFDEFAAAAGRLTRAISGIRGKLPTDTRLLPDSQGIIVETPAVESLVASDRPWGVSVAVESKRLVAVCATLKKLGAVGHSIAIGLDERQLRLKFRTTTISLPTLWAEAGRSSALPAP